ncbi:MAG TPA: DNA adenine methylase, partial [Patescibacteria group bacterium]|nr:DNA adenine methylase [Patescibacteria group bacterium]
NELSSAQVIHNKLTNENGWELCLINNGEKTIIAQTVKVQDINAYSNRDRNRPSRDPKTGMLPPKLAQIIINLSVGILPESERLSVCDILPDKVIPIQKIDKTLLDPFCGTGVILQEALLTGYRVSGSDINEKLIGSSKENLDWLLKNYQDLNEDQIDLKVCDARTFKWPPFDTVASEAYLGQPYSTVPNDIELANSIKECNLLIEKFLTNLASQTMKDFRLCLAVPAWHLKSNILKTLPLIDHLPHLGYNLINFKEVDSSNLVYYRTNQIVGRQLLVLKRF